METQRFRDILKAEFEQRRASNAAYSLRRFARFLGIHHVTLLRLLDKPGATAERSIRRLAPRLGLSEIDVRRLCIAECEEAIVDAIDQKGFRPDSRWLASASGVPVDRVNATLQSLLRKKRLRMVSTIRWITRKEVA